MPFPERLLLPGEEVLLECRPRLVRLLRPGLVVLAVAAASVASVVVWVGAPIWFGWVLLGAIGLSVLHLAARAAQWRAEGLTVTSRRVVLRAGVLRRTGREIPIGSVQSVSYRQGLLQRVLRTGDLVVVAAGESSSEPIPDVPDPAGVQARISAAIGQGTRPPPGPAPTPWTAWASGRDASVGPGPGPARQLSPAPSLERGRGEDPDTAPTPAAREPAGLQDPLEDGVLDRLERLASLYERGLLTRVEFEAAKADVLARH